MTHRETPAVESDRAVVTRIVAAAPPLTPFQRAQLAVLLRPGALANTPRKAGS